MCIVHGLDSTLTLDSRWGVERTTSNLHRHCGLGAVEVGFVDNALKCFQDLLQRRTIEKLCLEHRDTPVRFQSAMTAQTAPRRPRARRHGGYQLPLMYHPCYLVFPAAIEQRVKKVCAGQCPMRPEVG